MPIKCLFVFFSIISLCLGSALFGAQKFLGFKQKFLNECSWENISVGLKFQPLDKIIKGLCFLFARLKCEMLEQRRSVFFFPKKDYVTRGKHLKMGGDNRCLAKLALPLILVA